VLHLVKHPLVHECLAELRDARTGPERFRALTNRISVLLGAEALRDVPTIDDTVHTPLGPSPCRRLAADVVMAPVLRAGLGMLPGMLELVPNARVGHLGLASQYYAKLPKDIENSYVLLIDPMLATGGSAVAALDMLTKAGARHLRLVCIVAAPEGVAAVEKAYPTVPIFSPAVDRELNAHKFIVPGLGDFGDRLFGTL
jgi:uracil phosphoribosyltransferase